MTQQIKSKQRVSDHGEVFTRQEEVNAMLDLVKDETLRIESRFLEPACGDGNFLIEILKRKLALIKNKHIKKRPRKEIYRSQRAYEFDLVLVIGSIYGIELQQDNVIACRETITLSCGKLTTGVSVAPWTGIFMLRNLNSPETYFQAAFRVQTPWVLRGHNPNDPNNECIVKEDCYVFDFAPDRALKQLADYCVRLNTDDKNPEQKVAEFIQFLPVLAYDGSSMRSIDAAGILDMAMSGTTATLLARRWESALLVNVDNETLSKLRHNEDAMKALMSIEGFRSLNQDIETIINRSESVKKAKKEASERDLTSTEKKQLSEDEKKEKSLRKQVQEKLIKFATRIPIFMYLTDNREYSLKDVITQLEPELFYKVTGLTQKDFSLLVSLNLFNSGQMNDAVYKFKRYEDSSLSYSGMMKHQESRIGLYDTTISIQEYEMN